MFGAVLWYFKCKVCKFNGLFTYAVNLVSENQAIFFSGFGTKRFQRPTFGRLLYGDDDVVIFL